MKDTKQLASQYVACAKNLRLRMDELKTDLASTKKDTEIYNLNRRIKLLQNEYYDCVKIARHLEGDSLSTTLENGIWPSTKTIYKPNKKGNYYS